MREVEGEGGEGEGKRRGSGMRGRPKVPVLKTSQPTGFDGYKKYGVAVYLCMWVGATPTYGDGQR